MIDLLLYLGGGWLGWKIYSKLKSKDKTHYGPQVDDNVEID